MLSGSRVKLRFIVICILLGTIPAIIVGAFSVSREDPQTVRDKVNKLICCNPCSGSDVCGTATVFPDHVMIQFIRNTCHQRQACVGELTGEQFCIFNTVEDTVNNLPYHTVSEPAKYVTANLNKSWAIDANGIYTA